MYSEKYFNIYLHEQAFLQILVTTGDTGHFIDK